jgi:Family of unknown function (DUF5947)
VSIAGPQVPSSVSPRFRALRRFSASKVVSAEAEQCDLCSTPIGGQHRHLLERENRKIVCACDSCALRFEGVIGGRFALIPRDARRIPGFQILDSQWAEFSLPIDLAFFFNSTTAGRVIALYPSPAGAVESLLTFEAWNGLVNANPALSDLVPDVEALLVNRRGASRSYFVAPIDRCFQLVGLIRRRWTGLSGGSEVWGDIDGFFSTLDPFAEQRIEVGHA